MRKRYNGRVLLADEMGLGKSLQALTFMNREQAFPCIIVCPASLKWNWEVEVSKHLGLFSEVMEGRKPPARRMIDHQIVIINYDILNGWVDYLKKLGASLLILDEAHYCMNPKTIRSKAVKRLAKKIPYLIACDGTPLTDRPKQVFPIAQLIRPDLYKRFRPFADRYCAPHLSPWGWKYDGATRLPELHRKLKRQMMIRRTKAQVASDLPPKTLTVLPVNLDNRSEYQIAAKDFLNWIRRREGVSKAKRLSKSERMARFGYLKRLAAELKMNSIIEWIDNFLIESDEKLVVFGIHKKILRPLFERYRKIAVRIDGSVIGRARQRAKESFQNKKRKRLLFGNIKAAGVGADYTAARTSLFVELPWTPGDLGQAIDRLHRLTQNMPVFAYFMIGKNTIEELLWDRLAERQEILNAVLDGSEADLTSLFDALEQDFMESFR